MSVEIISKIVMKKKCLEIGGPSHSTFMDICPVYKLAKTVDNVIFSKDTVWHKSGSLYNYHPGKNGKVFIGEGTNLQEIENNSYDIILSSHSLEHMANPLQGVKEWLRVLKPKGYIILVLPDKNNTFDHKRDVTKFEVLKDKFDRQVGENDLSCLPEILEKHDLIMDPPAGTLEQFTNRSLKNYENRCLHHHVFDFSLLKQISDFFNCKYISQQLYQPFHQYVVIEKNDIYSI